MSLSFVCLQTRTIKPVLGSCPSNQAKAIDSSGIYTDSSKKGAIAHFPAPVNVAELQRFMGMVNQMGKLIHWLAEINKPLHQLLCKDTA